jgi:hypothetical protein
MEAISFSYIEIRAFTERPRVTLEIKYKTLEIKFRNQNKTVSNDSNPIAG